MGSAAGSQHLPLVARSRKDRAMAAPSSSSSSKPQRAAASRPNRKFTLEQANRALPLVKRIVADIVRTHAQAASHREKLERTSSTKDGQPIERVVDQSIDRLQDLVDELSDVGVE